ncbi:MAG TPA: thioredoxin family protein [Bacillota bacterium]|nr:thioredoxin family protein [Bacillota bacterium]
MRSKMVMIIGAVVILFAALYFVVDYKNKQKLASADNPYGKDELAQETIDQLDDPLYQNQITPDALAELLTNGEDVTVYFYSPTCVYCRNTTPVLVPLAEELGIDLKKLNLLEFRDSWDTYGIKGTPTLIHYENGEEANRISGEQPEEVFREFLAPFVANK